MPRGLAKVFNLTGVWFALGYFLIVWIILSNEALFFPLHPEDQLRVARALGGDAIPPNTSWISPLLDRCLAWGAPESTYARIQVVRRFGVIFSMLGLAVWIWRSVGWVQGIWVAILAVVFLPNRFVAQTLAPECLSLPLLVWGYALAFGKNWTKTGTAESVGGGILLGCSAFAAPWGWLFVAAIPLRTLFSAAFRKRLEPSFWKGLALGLSPGMVWLFAGWILGSGRDVGLHLETLTAAKVGQVRDLILHAWGIPFTGLVILGIWFACKQTHQNRERAIDLTWPLVPAALLGYANPIGTCLASPGLILFCWFGLAGIGRIFVSRTEQMLVPTLLAAAFGYYAFFQGLPAVRAQQLYAQHSASLANLIQKQVPNGDTIALFRLNPLVGFLNSIPSKVNGQTGDRWRSIDTQFFLRLPSKRAEAQAMLLGELGSDPVIWIDPARLREITELGGKERIAELKDWFETEEFVGEHGVTLLRVVIHSSAVKEPQAETP